MPIHLRVQCPACASTFKADERLVGKSTPCPKCRHPIEIGYALADEPAAAPRGKGSPGATSPAARVPRRPSEVVAAPEIPMDEYELRPPDVRFNLLFSVGWAFVAASLALLAPLLALYLGGIEQLLGFGLLVATAAIVVWNLSASLRIVGCTGRTRWALPLTAAQVLLFTVLFMQLYYHVGAGCFVVERPPRLADWLIFSGLRAFHAADMVDTLEAYGLHVRMIRPRGVLAGTSVVLFQMIVDFFILKVAFDWWGRLKKYLVHDLKLETLGIQIYLGILAAFLTAWLISAIFVRPWQPRDFLLWPLDNVLRVVDVFDLMDVLDVHLDQVPTVPWEGTLTFVFRFLLSVALADLASRGLFVLSFRWFHGYGLRVTELEEIAREHENPRFRQIALARMKAIERATAEAVAAVRRTWTADWHAVLSVSVMLGGLILLAIAAARDPLPALTRRVGTPDVPAERRALRAIARMGISAEGALPALVDVQGGLPTDRRQAIVRTMGQLGPASVEALYPLALDADAAVALEAVRALASSGPEAAPRLLDVAAASPSEQVRRDVERAVLALGPRAVPPLLETLTDDNLTARLPILEQLDPYWDRQLADNPFFRRVVENYRAIRVLNDPDSSPGRVAEAAPIVARQGNSGLEILWQRLSRDSKSADAISQVLIAMRQEAVPFLLQKAVGSADDRGRASGLLVRIGGPAAPLLAESLTGSSPELRSVASGILVQIGPAAVDALAPMLADVRPGAAEAARGVLEQIGPAGTVQLSTHLQDPKLQYLVRDLLFELQPDVLLEAAELRMADRILRIGHAIQSGDRSAARRLLAECGPGPHSWKLSRLAALANGRTPVAIEEPAQPNGHLTFSADGSQIVSAAQGAKARVWDAASGSPANDMPAALVSLTSLSADGRLAVRNANGAVLLLDAFTGASVGELGSGGRDPESAASDSMVSFFFGDPEFSLDGTRLFVQTGVLDAADGRFLWQRERSGNQVRSAVLSSTAMSPDGKQVAMARTTDEEIRVMRPTPGQSRERGSGFESFGVVRVEVVDVDTGRVAFTADIPVAERAGGRPASSRVVFSPRGDRLATAIGKDIYQVDISGGSQPTMVTLPPDHVVENWITLAYSPCGTWLLAVSASYGSTEFYLADAQTGGRRRQVTLGWWPSGDSGGPDSGPRGSRRLGVWPHAFSPDGETLAVAVDGKWSFPQAALPSGSDGEPAAIPKGDRGVVLVDLNSGRYAGSLNEADTATRVSFSPDGLALAVQGSRGITVWQGVHMPGTESTPEAAQDWWNTLDRYLVETWLAAPVEDRSEVEVWLQRRGVRCIPYLASAWLAAQADEKARIESVIIELGPGGLEVLLRQASANDADYQALVARCTSRWGPVATRRLVQTAWFADEAIRSSIEPSLAQLPDRPIQALKLMLRGKDAGLRDFATRLIQPNQGPASAGGSPSASGPALAERLAQAAAFCSAGNHLRAAETLNQIPDDLRNWEWSYLAGLAAGHAPREIPASGRVSFNGDGSMIFVESREGMTIWDAVTGSQLDSRRNNGKFEANGAGLTVAASPDERLVIGAPGNDDLYVLTAARKLFSNLPTGLEMETVGLDRNQEGYERRLLSPPAGRPGAPARPRRPERHETVIWDTVTFQPHTIVRTADRLTYPTFSSDGGRLAAIVGQEIVEFDTSTGRETGRVPLHGVESPTALRYCAAGRSVAAIHPQGITIVSFDADQGDFEVVSERAALSENGRWIAECDGKGPTGELRMWDVSSRERIIAWPCEAAGMAVSPDGSRVVTVVDATDRGVGFEWTVWDTAKGEALLRGSDQAADLTDVRFSPRGSCLAIVYEGRTVLRPGGE